MPDRSRKPPPTDPNLLARSILNAVTGEAPRPSTEPTAPSPPPDDGKNPAAVALGRLGGLKGGKARAKALSKKRRGEIAKKAARARWARTPAR